MLYLRRVLSVALPLALLAACGAPASAKNPGKNTAVQLLLEAQLKYQNLDFVPARTTLWKAYEKRVDLSGPQRKMLGERLGEVDQAIRQKVIGLAVFNMAGDAMKSKNWRVAQSGFGKVADCSYLPDKLRYKAKKNLAIVETKLALQKAKDRTSPKSVVILAAGAPPVKESSAKPEKVKPSAKTKPAQKIIAAKKVDSAKKPISAKKTVAKTKKPGVLTELQARRIKVDMLIARGRDALNKNQPAKAVGYFQRALKLEGDNEMARRQLDYAHRQTARPGDAGVLSDLERHNRIARQIAEHDIQEAIQRSMELMVAPDSREAFDAAEQAALVSKNILQNNKRLFGVTEYRERLAKTEDQIKWVRNKLQTWEKARVRETVKKIDHADRVRKKQIKLRRDQKIAELLLRAHKLREKREYQQTLRILDQIVELDPQNTWAVDNIYILKQFIVLHSQQSMAEAGRAELSKISADIRASEIPWYEKIRYPKDWKELSARRERYGAGVAAESEEDRRVRTKLRGRLAKVTLIGEKFTGAVDYVREVSGVNIFVNWRALEFDNPTISEEEINVVLSDVTVEKALQLILEDAGGGVLQLGYVINEGVINISTQEKLSTNVYPQVYDIRDLLIRVPNFVGTPVDITSIGDTTTGTGTGTSGTSGGGGGGDIWGGDGGEGEDGEGGYEGEAITKGEMIQHIQELISTTVDRESWYPNGSASINELSGSLVISQTAENHRFIQELIARLRETRTIQIAIEARFITVSTGFLSQIGVDLDFYFNIGSQIGGPSMIDPLTGLPFANPPQGSTTDPYTGATIPLRNTSGWNQAGNNADASLRKMSPITIGQNSSTFGNVFNQQTNVPLGIGTLVSAPAMSITGTFLDDLQVDFLIQATQAHTSTRTLTAPRLTLFNGQRAIVQIATQQAYIAGIEPIVSENASALQPIINYAPTGTLLDVDATVSHDRRYVTMTLQPQVMTLNGAIREVEVLSGDSAIFIGLPNITVQEIRTTVSVPDGGTLLIGGQKLSGEIEREMGVPVLSKLPIINRAFTNKGKLRDEQTLLILIKPQIIIQDEVELDPRLRKEKPPFEPGLSHF